MPLSSLAASFMFMSLISSSSRQAWVFPCSSSSEGGFSTTLKLLRLFALSSAAVVEAVLLRSSVARLLDLHLDHLVHLLLLHGSSSLMGPSNKCLFLVFFIFHTVHLYHYTISNSQISLTAL